MAETDNRSLDAILADIEREDPVGKKLASAREHLRLARLELGLPEPKSDDDGRNERDAGHGII